MSRGQAISRTKAKPQVIDGIRFASQAEATRYGELLYLQKSGYINALEVQPRFVVFNVGGCVIEYVADFAYWQSNGNGRVVEDVKGMKTADYMLKRKMFLAVFNYELWEIHGKKRQRVTLQNGRAYTRKGDPGDKAQVRSGNMESEVSVLPAGGSRRHRAG